MQRKQISWGTGLSIGLSQFIPTPWAVKCSHPEKADIKDLPWGYSKD